MSPEGCMRAGILPGCPGQDRRNREAAVRFEQRTFRPEDNMLEERQLTLEFRYKVTTVEVSFASPQRLDNLNNPHSMHS
ncbi:hypothetical protein T265_10129 [Opisthorchis viverrini]|uniref:Uncharacterized protein n=1 Tax=Opisthorchis viverrini TaxID=6198 RepID=A0A075A2I3_OPIVI|nr:hypothetical protein T265_10129 [Opisthorchis viverrini]KER21594.1 hypothetical protein T265_10129 [Opisthorchis viverrini]